MVIMFLCVLTVSQLPAMSHMQPRDNYMWSNDFYNKMKQESLCSNSRLTWQLDQLTHDQKGTSLIE